MGTNYQWALGRRKEGDSRMVKGIKYVDSDNQGHDDNYSEVGRRDAANGESIDPYRMTV